MSPGRASWSVRAAAMTTLPSPTTCPWTNSANSRRVTDTGQCPFFLDETISKGLTGAKLAWLRIIPEPQRRDNASYRFLPQSRPEGACFRRPKDLIDMHYTHPPEACNA